MKTNRLILIALLTLSIAAIADAQCMMGSGDQHKHSASKHPGEAGRDSSSEGIKAYAFINDSGKQEATVTILNGYQPNVIVVKKGLPLVLNFDLQEEGCTGTVVIADFGVKEELVPFEMTSVEFTPDRSGLFSFACPMGMIEGTLDVKE